MSAERVAGLRERRVRLGETHLGRAAVERAPVYVDDVQQDSTLGPDRGGLLEGIHAVLAVPLLREDKVVGGLVIRRRPCPGRARDRARAAVSGTGGARRGSAPRARRSRGGESHQNRAFWPI